MQNRHPNVTYYDADRLALKNPTPCDLMGIASREDARRNKAYHQGNQRICEQVIAAIETAHAHNLELDNFTY